MKTHIIIIIVLVIIIILLLAFNYYKRPFFTIESFEADTEDTDDNIEIISTPIAITKPNIRYVSPGKHDIPGINYINLVNLLYLHRLLRGMNPTSWETGKISLYITKFYSKKEIDITLDIIQKYTNWLNKRIGIKIDISSITKSDTKDFYETQDYRIIIPVLEMILYYYSMQGLPDNITKTIEKLYNYIYKYIVVGNFAKIDIEINNIVNYINKENNAILCSNVEFKIFRDPYKYKVDNTRLAINQIYNKHGIRCKLHFQDYFTNENLSYGWEVKDGHKETRFKANISKINENGGMRQKILPNIKYPKKKWSAGEIVSKDKFGYGYYEASMKYANATGINNAFWLTSSPPPNKDKPSYVYTKTFKGTTSERLDEIDINEGHGINVLTMTLHQWLNNYGTDRRTTKTITTTNLDLSKDYHLYGFLYTKEKLQWFIDDILVKTYDNTNPDTSYNNQKLRIKFSTTFPPTAGKVIDSELAKAPHMDTEFVRFYKQV